MAEALCAIIEGEDAPGHEPVGPELSGMRVTCEVEVHAARGGLLDAQRLVLHRNREGVGLCLRELGVRGNHVVFHAHERYTGDEMHRAAAQAAHAVLFQALLLLAEVHPVRVVVAEDRIDAPGGL